MIKKLEVEIYLRLKNLKVKQVLDILSATGLKNFKQTFIYPIRCFSIAFLPERG